MKRAIANLFFAFVLNVFKSIKCSYNVSMSHNIFFYLIKGKFRNINLRDAILGTGVTLNDDINLFNKPEIFGKVSIGKYTSINGPSTRICADVTEINIGAFCSIASNVVIQEFYHNYNMVTTYNINSNIIGEPVDNEKISKGPIIIEDDVWIGSNSVILSGVKIGRGSIIGAGSIVTKDVEAYSIVGGNPAKFLRKRFDQQTIDKLEKSEWWLWDKEKIIRNKKFFKHEIL
ncbi:CatB-related O-acetyltransferase [Chryseobacterium oranimense]|uniref:CatB-related O-acetyltransferase n=1 Tax=Chryseobacterium oranimense TaxID=421058 RepID=UPI0021AEBDF5|nr:CatB-related O-acetyltransferase [Chryseobacterium oranimense]UWX60778.1 CatB-related O-acetyltransferase [Chryseobacterium oranimense]